jgi:hypothetical protein
LTFASGKIYTSSTQFGQAKKFNTDEIVLVTMKSRYMGSGRKLHLELYRGEGSQSLFYKKIKLTKI